jgi:hypothetical protein
MAWKLPRQPHRVFQRNPLVAASPLGRLLAASLAHVEAIASALPVDAEDERIVDELMSRQAASMRTRPLGRGRTGSR